jgi:hypothetical protein
MIRFNILILGLKNIENAKMIKSEASLSPRRDFTTRLYAHEDKAVSPTYFNT